MGILDFFRARRASLEQLAEKRRKSRKAKARIRVQSRVNEVLDPGSSQPLCTDIKAADPLGFPGYAEKVADLARRSGRTDAFYCATGTIEGHGLVCAELVSELLMGSMGTAVGEAVCQCAEYALKHRLPLVIFSASGGARMQEGMFSLMQMAKTSAAIRRLADAGILYISVLTHPTTGGVTASFASLGDIIIAEPGALIGFAGPRVIEQTLRSTLPEGFQSAEFQQAHGFVDMIVERGELRRVLARLLAFHQNNQNTQRYAAAMGHSLTAQHGETSGNFQDCLRYPVSDAPSKTPREKVEIARHQNRPHAPAFIASLFEEFTVLQGDRLFAEDSAILCGIARFEGQVVSLAAHLKGSDLTENLSSNFGMPHPEGYRKFIRIARQAEKFGRPLITLIDTPGAYPGAEAEERGQGEAIARCLFELSGLSIPIIAIVTGEGGSGGALALGLADRIFMYEHAVYSVLSPEGFATILWKDAGRASEACDVMKLTAEDLADFDMIDGIIAEPPEGAHHDPETAVQALRPVIRTALAELCTKDTSTLLAERYEKFRKYR